ncbi:hypothetical protein [Chroococcidiopsis sp. CCALA 051]|uniref:hypothetical protein n=1 Tax=Chroococcidiopsis sp. CCALA 051 TaxID=869949 RepID=UPI001304CC1F|nr:hypothetical protein [Chroococcidiopsis sp. CCALA 051]
MATNHAILHPRKSNTFFTAKVAMTRAIAPFWMDYYFGLSQQQVMAVGPKQTLSLCMACTKTAPDWKKMSGK